MSQLITEKNTSKNEEYALMLNDFVCQQGDLGAKLLSNLRHYIKYCGYKSYPLNIEDREEILQETAIKIISHHKSIKNNHYAWLLKVTHNEYNNRLRKIVNNENIVEVISQNKVIITNDNDLDHPAMGDHIVNDIDCFEYIFKQATDTASGENDREIYTQYIEGHSNKEIADKTGRSKSAIAKRLSILRERIRKLVIEFC